MTDEDYAYENRKEMHLLTHGDIEYGYKIIFFSSCDNDEEPLIGGWTDLREAVSYAKNWYSDRDRRTPIVYYSMSTNNKGFK